MKTNYFLLFVSLTIVFAACSTAKESTDVWVNKEKFVGKNFNSVFICVMTADVEARSVLETDLAARAVARGYKAVKSMDVMPGSVVDPKKPTREEIVSHVKTSGCDAVFVAALVKKEEAINYTPGSTAYSTMPNVSYVGGYYGYYNNYYATVSTPAYYSNDKLYVMQSNLYEASTEELMWSVRSNVFKPSNLKKFSEQYTSTLVKQLKDEKVNKK